jgi:hypothetical protein
MRATSVARAELMANHPRNIGPMNEAPRCGARTRAGTSCQSPAISGKARCRMHGGKGSGALKRNRNAFRHGAYTQDMLAKETQVRELCSRLRARIETLNSIARRGAEIVCMPGVEAPVEGRFANE